MTYLTKSEEFILKWQHRALGSFYSALAEAIIRADPHNRELLAKGFPEEVKGIEMFWWDSTWWIETQAKARQEY